MKATGIVRRIDARVIITPRAIKPHKHWVFTDFCPTQFAQIHKIHSKSERKSPRFSFSLKRYLLRSHQNIWIQYANKTLSSFQYFLLFRRRFYR